MPEIFTITGQHFICSEGQSLLDAMLEADIFIESPCGGNGKCGKCKVKIAGNHVPKATDEEIVCLSANDIADKFRLACRLYPDKEMTIQLPVQEKGHAILSEGYVPDFTPDINIDLNKKSYGLAVDIGTTTVVVSLIDMQSGTELGTEALINPQRNQGLDVLSRISYVQEHGKEGLAVLQSSIVRAIEEMALKLCGENNIAHDSLLDISVSANTTMLHLLLAENPLSLGIRPFTPVFTNAKYVKASELGMKHFANASVMTLPLVSAYIGADIVAGAYVCDMKHQTGNVLFIDIGTNGEMILAADGILFACSCAAGPALEGMNISCGMRAAYGAVEGVQVGQDGTVRLQVIGNTHPKGICGSGILSAVRELLRVSLIAPNGRLIRKNELHPDDTYYSLCHVQDGKTVIYLSPEIYITQGDIRQVQLAKGAVLSGVLAMLDRANIKPDELNKVLVAGQFGAHLPAEDLISCGLLPETLSPEKVNYVGNTSKTGAYIALLSKKARDDMEILAREINYIELAEMNGYDRLLAKCMKFS